MFKLVAVLLVAVSLSTGTPVKEARTLNGLDPFCLFCPAPVHDAIEKELKPKIDDLVRQIQLESDVSRVKINNKQTELKTLVNNNANDINQKIRAVRAKLSSDLQLSSTKADPAIEECVKIKVVQADALTSSAIGQCIPSDAVSRWNDIRNIFPGLKNTASNIVPTCRKSNPLASQSDTMRTCITTGIETGDAGKTATEELLTAELEKDTTATNTCVTNEVTTIQGKIDTLAEECAAPSA